jgi:hypothetical protein
MSSDILDLLRNIYSASGGGVHPSAVSAALYGALWNSAWDSALAAGQRAYDSGGSEQEVKDAFHRAFGDSLGWSEAQNREFWTNDAYDITAADAQRFDESWDAFDAFVEHMRRSGGR